MTHPVTIDRGQQRSGHSPRAVARTLQVIALCAAAVLLLWLLSDIVLLVFLAVLIAAILRGTGDWAAHHTGVPERAMLALVSVLVAAGLVGFAFFIGPRLGSESQDLWRQLHHQATQFYQTYGSTPWGHTLLGGLSPSAAMQGHIANLAGNVASSTLGGLVTAVVVIVTALYFAISPQTYLNGVVLLFPRPYRGRSRQVLEEVGRTLQWWSLGQLIDMVVVGVLTGSGLALLGVPLSLALGVLAGLLTFVPYFGAIVAAVPAVLIALTIGWQTSLWTMAIFLGAHTIEGYIVSPLVQRWTVHVPPAVSILSMTIMATIFGPLGLILGAPLAAALLVVVREAYVGDVLGDAKRTDTEDVPHQVLPPGPTPA